MHKYTTLCVIVGVVALLLLIFFMLLYSVVLISVRVHGIDRTFVQGPKTFLFIFIYLFFIEMYTSTICSV